MLTDKRVRTPRVDMRAHDVALSRRDQRDIVAPLAPLFLSPFSCTVSRLKASASDTERRGAAGPGRAVAFSDLA